MSVRFAKVLEQVAMAGRKGLGSGAGERASLRPEEIIRAREAAGDRVTIFLGLGLTVSAIAFPVYAIHASAGQPDVPRILPPIVGTIPVNKSLAAAAQGRFTNYDPATTGAVFKEDGSVDQTQGSKTASASVSEVKMASKRYVVWSVSQGVALVEGPDGLRAVVPGAVLPGAGQILSIEQAKTGWVVVTSETIIEQSSTKRL
ncbi:hypothetical protein ACFOYU_27335 [Microvirga sp. GCM10011540]|uniref:hypothetical protein n=1 Tax=Microvirga sp. GCM10011540 TaxID=3317338 RepID=UPI00360842F2